MSPTARRWQPAVAATCVALSGRPKDPAIRRLKGRHDRTPVDGVRGDAVSIPACGSFEGERRVCSPGLAVGHPRVVREEDKVEIVKEDRREHVLAGTHDDDPGLTCRGQHIVQPECQFKVSEMTGREMHLPTIWRMSQLRQPLNRPGCLLEARSRGIWQIHRKGALAYAFSADARSQDSVDRVTSVRSGLPCRRGDQGAAWSKSTHQTPGAASSVGQR